MSPDRVGGIVPATLNVQGGAKGTQRYQCKTCGKTHVETKGTVFYGRHHAQETILECLAWLAERNSLAALHRVKGLKEETVLAWLREAAKHVE